jgi:hypothetical protein
MREAFDRYIDSLLTAEREALYNDLPAVGALAKRLTTARDREFGRQLDFRGATTIISRLKKAGQYSRPNNKITDRRFPITGSGIVDIRFRIIPGEELSSDYWVWRRNVENLFCMERMRFPNAAEALLVPALDQEIGRGKRSLVMFIRGFECMFAVDGDSTKRNLHLFFGDQCHPCYDFLGVCK